VWCIWGWSRNFMEP